MTDKTSPTRLQVADGILSWLACAKIGIKLNAQGQPALKFPDPPEPDIDVQEVVAEIKPYREELIQLLQRDVPVLIGVRTPWRAYIAKWDGSRRKQWGELTSELEATRGLSWHEAEKTAYETICETFKTPTGRE